MWKWNSVVITFSKSILHMQFSLCEKRIWPPPDLGKTLDILQVTVQSNQHLTFWRRNIIERSDLKLYPQINPEDPQDHTQRNLDSLQAVHDRQPRHLRHLRQNHWRLPRSRFLQKPRRLSSFGLLVFLLHLLHHQPWSLILCHWTGQKRYEWKKWNLPSYPIRTLKKL